MEQVPPLVAGRARLLHDADAPPQLVVKFREDTCLTEDQSLEFIAAQTTQVFQAIAGEQSLLRAPRRATFAIPVEQVQAIMATARAGAAEDGRELPDLLKFYGRQTPSLRSLSMPDAILATQQLLDMVETIKASPLIETAYIESPPARPPVSVRYASDVYSRRQVYLREAPVGVGCLPLWNRVPEGNAGEGMMFVDVESGWYTDHEDLALASSTPLVGVNKNDKEHGTSVLGIINAVDNDKGIVGIAPKARGYIASRYITSEDDPWPFVAMLFAMLHLMADRRGHVMVVEMELEVDDPGGSGGSTSVLLPVEAELLNWLIVTIAGYCGVVVVEAAGNGDRSLKTGGIAALPADTFDFLDPTRNSGAIMVGAGEYSGSGLSPYTRYADSNYGSRVDCFARGDDMYTLTDSPDKYGTLNATSAATAIVAGVALVTQSLALKALGSTFDPPRLRDMVCGTTGTPSVLGSGIQSMPNLMRIGERVRSLA